MGTQANQKAITLVVACAGRRVELLQAFRRSAARLGVELRIVATDGAAHAPALFAADEAVLMPPIQDADYIPRLKDIVTHHEAQLLLPTIDTDLIKLAEAREEFAALGCHALIGPPDAIRMCRDKAETARFLAEHGIDTPKTFEPEEIEDAAALQYPLFLKPRSGSSSIGVHKLQSAAECDFLLPRVPGAIVQEFVPGVEYTIDVYVGLTGEPRCVVPRKRLQVRGGEVSKGVTVRDADIMAVGQRVVEAMGAGMRGLVTVQCMVTESKRSAVIEINPRFGGGAPLSIAAGADFPGWLLQEVRGETPTISTDGWQDGLCMLRYDWSVFAALDKLGERKPLADPPPFA
jgi:carbamoyl-phosphate synthase large subunit